MSFWERRRANVARETAAEARERAAAETAARETALAEKTDAELLAELDLPDPDALRPGDTIVAFMKREVPERLRRRAMRALWRSNPVLACVDGLNDYDGDFTNAATDMPGVVTGYIPGKGMRAHVEALARQTEARDAAAEAIEAAAQEDAPETVPETAPAIAATVPEARSGAEPGTAGALREDAAIPAPDKTLVSVNTAAFSGDPETATDQAPQPRRMRFRFEASQDHDRTEGRA